MTLHYLSKLSAFSDLCVLSECHATPLGSRIGSSVEGIKDTIKVATLFSATTVKSHCCAQVTLHAAYCTLFSFSAAAI